MSHTWHNILDKSEGSNNFFIVFVGKFHSLKILLLQIAGREIFGDKYLFEIIKMALMEL